MLLARQRPLAAAFRKRVPVDGVAAPKQRGFGLRQKLVATPRKPFHATGAAVPSSASMEAEAPAPAPVEETAAVDWANGLDWVGASDAGESVAAAYTNGHATTEAAERPSPEALPVATPMEVRTLN